MGGDDLLAIGVGDEDGGDVDEVAVAVVGHDDIGGRSDFVVVDDDHVCAPALGVQDLLRELALATFDEHELLHVIVEAGEGLDVLVAAEELFLRDDQVADHSAAVEDVAEVGQRVGDLAAQLLDGAHRHVRHELAAA